MGIFVLDLLILCLKAIAYMFEGNSLTDFTKPFSPNNLKKNDDTILHYFLTNF